MAVLNLERLLNVPKYMNLSDAVEILKNFWLYTRIWKNVRSTRLSEMQLFPLRRPPKQHILARMADKPGTSCGNGALRAAKRFGLERFLGEFLELLESEEKARSAGY